MIDFKLIRTQVVTFILSCLLGTSMAHAELPAKVDVATPSGEKFLVALPTGMCPYPKEIRQRLADFLANGQPALRLLGAAGDCRAIDRLTHGKSVIISPVIELAMLDSQVDRTKRLDAQTYRQWFLEKYPNKQTKLDTDAIRNALKTKDKKFAIGDERSLGILARLPDAIFGGTMISASNPPRQMIQLQVIACFSPNNVPILWTFGETVEAKPEKMATRFKALLKLAQKQVQRTIELNRSRN